MLGFFIRVTVIALIGYGVWRMIRPRYTLKIVIGKQGIKHYDGLPKAHKTSVLEFFEKHRSPGRATIKTTLSQLEHQTVAKAPQFGIRLLLGMLTTCALAFAILGASAHDCLNVLAAMIIIFWIGAALSFVGVAMDGQGDLWLGPASVAESIGLGVVVIALFTGAYYGFMFILAAFGMPLYS